MEEYYLQDVKSILNTLVEALTNQPHRKFSWVEMGFFSRWWSEQDPTVKQKFKTLLEKGQIEFTMGGWVSSDEASVNYIQSINQLTVPPFPFLLSAIGNFINFICSWATVIF